MTALCAASLVDLNHYQLMLVGCNYRLEVSDYSKRDIRKVIELERIRIIIDVRINDIIVTLPLVELKNPSPQNEATPIFFLDIRKVLLSHS